MQSLSLPCLALHTVGHYVLYPILSCSACYTPDHISHLNDVCKNNRFSEYFDKRSLYSSPLE